MNRPTKIITHHALSETYHTAEDVNLWHQARWPNFISSRGYYTGYHYVIDWDGTLTQTRENDEEGAHCIGQNTSSIGVCFMGNFDNHAPSARQQATWRWLYDQLGGTMPVYPHRKYARKSCHGSRLPDDYFAKLVDREYLLSTITRLQMLVNQLQSLILQRRMK